MRLFILSISVFFYSNLNAQNSSFKFNHYSLEEGLSQSTVYSILEDDLGYIWVGTRDGLNRFDEDKFVVFYPSFDENSSLSNRSVRALAQDSVGYIWIGTDGGGVDRLNPKTNTFINLCELLDVSVCSINTNITSLEVVNNNVLIGTRSQGSFKYDIAANTLVKELDIASTIWQIKSLGNTSVYATSNGIIVDISSNKKVLIEDAEIRAVEFITESEILVGSRTNGILKLNLITNKLSRLNKRLSNLEVADIKIDAENNIWVATDSKGIFLINKDGKIIQHFSGSDKLRYQLQSPSIRTLYKDSNGIMWIGSNNAGLSNYFKYRFQFQSYSNQSTNGMLSSDVILSFNELEDGKILIGTEQNGLLVFDSSNERFNSIEAFNNDNIIAIEKDLNGSIWVATDGSGLKNIDDEKNLNEVREISSLSGKSILSLEVAPNGDLLAGAYQGLFIISEGDVLDMSFVPEYLKQDRVLAIKFLGDNEYLLGTFSSGLILFNRNDLSFKRYSKVLNDKKPSKRSPERVQAIYVDTKGRIWLGTYSGLYEFDRKNEVFTQFTVKKGLPSDVVYGILEDEKQNLWLSTNLGISKFNPEKENFFNYTLSDGLLSNEFNGGAYFKDSNGFMYYGGVKGFTLFNPANIIEFNLLGNIVIYEMNVDGEVFNTLTGTNFNLGDEKDYIQFSFSYLNFLNSDKNSIEYRLIGLSNNWVPVEKRRTINFAGLSSGNYTFQLRSINRSGTLSNYSSLISFYIKPVMWKRWYFILIVILFLMCTGYALFRYRMYYLIKDEETRNRIAKDLHDDLSSTLSSISFFSEAAKKEQLSPLQSGKYLERIEQSALEAKDKINDIIWAIDPEHDDWIAFIAKCKRYAAETFESKNIEYLIQFDDTTNIDSYSLRQHLWLAFKEIITNIVRHSKAKNAKVILIKSGNNLLLSIEDDGVGFPDKSNNRGNGIANLRFRAEKMNAELSFEKVKPSGSKWILVIPL